MQRKQLADGSLEPPPSSPLLELHHTNKPRYTGLFGEAIAPQVDGSSISLVLTGNCGCGTSWHRDTAEAENLALLMVPEVGTSLMCILIMPAEKGAREREED